jgi:hypothetical protein
MSMLLSESCHTSSKFYTKPRNSSYVKFGRIYHQIKYSKIPLVWHLTGVEFSHIQICDTCADLTSHW